MSQPKQPITNFDSGWNTIRAWAKSQKIPDTAVNNVYQMDLARIQPGHGGYAMSNAERTRAILAAAGGNYNTALPSDSPSTSPNPGAVYSNLKSNAQSIFEGLHPARLVSNIWHTILGSVDTLTSGGRSNKGANPMETAANTIDNTLLSWIPGVYDLGTFLKAQGASGGNKMAGLEALAQQPLSTALDVVPFGKVGDMGARSFARTAMGDALAQRLGIPSKAMGNLGAVGIAKKAIGSIQVGSERGLLQDATGAVRLDEHGLPMSGTRTLSQRLTRLTTSLGTGKLLSQKAYQLAHILHTKTLEGQRNTRDLFRAAAPLTRDKIGRDGQIVEQGTLSQFNELTHSGRGFNEMMNDTSIPVPVRGAIRAYKEWADQHQEMVVAAGHLLPYVHHDGTTSYYEASSAVFAKRAQVDAALAKADAASVKVDQISDEMLARDEQFAPLASQIQHIKDMLAIAANNAPKGIRKAQLNMIGRLAGHGGLLDQLQSALDRQNWTELKTVAGKVKRLLNSKTAADWQRVPLLSGFMGLIDQTIEHARARLKLETDAHRAYFGVRKSQGRPGVSASERVSADTLNRRAAEAMNEFKAWVRANPSGQWRDVFQKLYNQKFLESAKAQELLDRQAAGLKEIGAAPEVVDRIHSDPARMQEVIASAAGPMFNDPRLPRIATNDAKQWEADAKATLERRRQNPNAEDPMWVPTVGAQAIRTMEMDPRVRLNNPMRAPTISAAKQKVLNASSTVNDVMLGVHHSQQELMAREAALAFFPVAIKPMLQDGTTLHAAVTRDNLIGLEADTAGTVSAGRDSLIRATYNYAPFGIKEHLGVDPEAFGLDPHETYYLPAEFAHQMGKMLSPGGHSRLFGVMEKGTGVFKWSILALSPRYTAHVLLGGTMLLALRSNPGALLMMNKAFKDVWAYHKGEIPQNTPEEVFQGAAESGNPIPLAHYKGGGSIANLHKQDWLVNHGIDPKYAKVIDVAKATADINFRFTTFISDWQRCVAYLDGARAATRKGTFVDPVTGEKRAMTPEKAVEMGMYHAEQVMGNLSAMTPFEQTVARTIFPFYGWTKHVLKYVLTYPTDHPFRTQFLSVLAQQNSSRFSSGLDQRMQLLFFIGSPDASGNVSAIDARTLDPFRDVANYATFAGWFSAMTPLISAPMSVIDPQLIYGGNVLHPTVTYDAFYGTNVAQPAGNLMNAVEAEVPLTSILDNAIGITAQARAAKAAGGNAATKALYQALDIPFFQVQHLNLQQIAAKHEIDRYNQAKAAAANAWQTGDFSELMAYPGTVPDPLQTGYNITPAALQKQYQEALARYPGFAPSETVASLPAPVL